MNKMKNKKTINVNQLCDLFRKAGYNEAMIESLKRDIKLTKEESQELGIKIKTPLMKSLSQELGIEVL